MAEDDVNCTLIYTEYVKTTMHRLKRQELGTVAFPVLDVSFHYPSHPRQILGAHSASSHHTDLQNQLGFQDTQNGLKRILRS